MNAFYERLSHFGMLINNASSSDSHNYADYFTVQHPSHPVVSSTKSVVPKLIFKEECPKDLRRKVRCLLRKSFERISNKQ